MLDSRSRTRSFLARARARARSRLLRDRHRCRSLLRDASGERRDSGERIISDGRDRGVLTRPDQRGAIPRPTPYDPDFARSSSFRGTRTRFSHPFLTFSLSVCPAFPPARQRTRHRRLPHDTRRREIDSLYTRDWYIAYRVTPEIKTARRSVEETRGLTTRYPNGVAANHFENVAVTGRIPVLMTNIAARVVRRDQLHES